MASCASSSSSNKNTNNNNENNNEFKGQIKNALHAHINKLFHVAVERGDLEKVNEFLLAGGADVNSKNRNGFTATARAISMNDLDLLKLLIIDYEADLSDFELLKLACEKDNVAVIKLLVKHGAYIYLQDLCGNNLMHICAMYDSRLTFEWLMNSGVDINEKNIYEETPLHIACIRSRYEMVHSLCIQPDIERNVIDNEGCTPLLRACLSTKENNIKIIKCLIGRDLDINIKDDKNRSPLDLACKNDLLEIVKLLMSQPELNRNICNENTLDYLKSHRLIN